MKAWNKLNKNIFTAPFSCKNKNKLNKVDIVSSMENCKQINTQKYTQTQKYIQ